MVGIGKGRCKLLSSLSEVGSLMAPSLGPDTHPRRRRNQSSPASPAGELPQPPQSSQSPTHLLALPMLESFTPEVTPLPVRKFQNLATQIQEDGKIYCSDSPVREVCLPSLLPARLLQRQDSSPVESPSISSDIPAKNLEDSFQICSAMSPAPPLCLYSEVVAADPPPTSAHPPEPAPLATAARGAVSARLTFAAPVLSRGQDRRILKSGRVVQPPLVLLYAFRTLNPAAPRQSWQVVRSKRWRGGKNQSSIQANNQVSQQRRARFIQHMAGRCYRCLRSSHQVAN